MILELYAILMLVSLTLVYLGFYTETKVLATVGFFFIFLLSIPLINNALQYESGVTVNEINSSSTVITYQHSTFSDPTRTYGIYLALASAIGMILTFIIGKEWKVKN